jgi:hypothetical protein
MAAAPLKLSTVTAVFNDFMQMSTIVGLNRIQLSPFRVQRVFWLYDYGWCK